MWRWCRCYYICVSRLSLATHCGGRRESCLPFPLPMMKVSLQYIISAVRISHIRVFWSVSPLQNPALRPLNPGLFCSCVSPVSCEDNMKKIKVKRVDQFDESTDVYTEFFKPYELTSFDDTFCITMTNSARWLDTLIRKRWHRWAVIYHISVKHCPRFSRWKTIRFYWRTQDSSSWLSLYLYFLVYMLVKGIYAQDSWSGSKPFHCSQARGNGEISSGVSVYGLTFVVCISWLCVLIRHRVLM